MGATGGRLPREPRVWGHLVVSGVFLSVLPQFIDYEAGDVLGQSVMLGVALTAAFAGVNALVAVSSGRAAAMMVQRPRWLLAQRCVTGGILVLLGLRMGIQAW